MLMLVFCVGACAESGSKTKTKISYKESAKGNFEKGKAAFDEENYLKATEYFRFIRNRFPFSVYAAESDLLIADSLYLRDKYVEASEYYTNFIKLHPRHKKVGYASFKIGVCHIERMPSDFFLFPPAFELDQKETVAAIRELKSFLRLYPEDENVPEARRWLTIAENESSKLSHFVMNLNLKKEKFRGALWRAQEILKDFPTSKFIEEALLVQAECQMELKDLTGSKSSLDEFNKKYTQSRFAGRAKKLALKLRKPASGETGR
jgi:outer membrane protein assembly factor BamD